MKIAQVSPLYESVPPKLYGGTERVVSYLAEELVRQGHEVTLFASGDSVTRARLIPGTPRALRLDRGCLDPLAHHLVMFERVFEAPGRFDIIHFHTDYLHLPLCRRIPVPQVTTLHGRLDMPDLVPIYKEFREAQTVSISNAQRVPLRWLNWQGTVYHGVPVGQFQFHPSADGYLAFLGRISPEKRVEDAIEIARRAGMPLRIAAKVDKVDEDYFEDIRPLLEDPLVDYLGEIGEEEKSDFLGGAVALLFPIDWPEPFGLVMIESMACGTPVIARRRGSVPEVIDDGVSGFVFDTLDEAVNAVARARTLSRARCRAVFEERFTCARMASDYLAIYQQTIERSSMMGSAAALP